MQRTHKRERLRRVGVATLATALGLASLSALGSPASAVPANEPGSADSPACSSASVQLIATTGSAPQNLCVPAEATEHNKTLLVWNKPGVYDDVVDYRVYINGQPLGTAEENAKTHSPAQEYIDAFRAADRDGFHAKTVAHNFTVTGWRHGPPTSSASPASGRTEPRPLRVVRSR